MNSFNSPLRYPGGKRRLAPLIGKLIDYNGLSDCVYIEPFAGGASVALYLLFEQYASDVHINDLSRPVYAFWHTVLNECEWICDRIMNVTINMDEWYLQHSIYCEPDIVDLKELGFSAFFMNRTNRSGILDGGPIGGKKQNGSWLLDARFNRNDLVNRIRKINRYNSRITLHNVDGLELTQQLLPSLGSQSLSFFDPPYIVKGSELYLNELTVQNHLQLSTTIVDLTSPWIVTYDIAALDLDMYSGLPHLTYSLSYSAQTRYSGQEVLFHSTNLSLPDEFRRFSIS